MYSFNTCGVARHERLESWCHAVGKVFAPLDIRPRQRDDFLASMECHRSGRLALVKVAADPATVRRREINDQHGNPAHQYFLHMLLQGRLHVSQRHQGSVLSPGDMVLCDASQPYTLENRQPCTLLVMLIDGRDMAGHLNVPQALTGLHLPATHALCATASAMLPHLYQHAARHLDHTLGSRLQDGFLEILAAACTSLVGASAPETTSGHLRRMQIRQHIEAHLRESQLTPTSIANAFNISTRYLNMLFSAQNESVCGYILRRRLEQCARQLRDAQWARRSLTEIAFSWGFNNAAHFTRTFSARYAMCPRRYRRLHGEAKIG